MRRLAAVVGVLALAALAPSARADAGALSQLPGTAACMSNDAYAGSPGLCRQAIGLDGVQSVAVSPDGDSLYTAAVGSDAIDAFSLDSATGLPSQVPGAGGCVAQTANEGCTLGQGLSVPDWVTVSPDGADVYATAATSQSVDTFSRDPDTGGLTELGCLSSSAAESSCASASGLNGAASVTLSPDGDDAYVTAYTAGTLTEFARLADGSLLQTGCLANRALAGCTVSGTLSGSTAAIVSPDGDFVYAAARLSQAVTVYARDPATGLLTRLGGTAGCVGEAAATASCAQGVGMKGPNSLSVSPDGRLLFVANFTHGQGAANDTVAVFSRDAGSGALTELGCLSGTPNPDPACTAEPALGGNFAVTASPGGDFVYLTDYQSDAISAFAVGPSGLTRLPGASGCVGETTHGKVCAQGVGLDHPHETIVAPDGSFAYVVANQSDTLDVFATVPAETAPPKASQAPVITGTPQAGSTLSATSGSWTGTQSGYAYQWESCTTAGKSCTAIPGARGYILTGEPFSATYQVAAADVGHTLRVAVSATGSAGTTTSTSRATRVITSGSA